MPKTKLINVQYHIYPTADMEIKYNHSTCLYEIENARSTYKMPFKQFIDFRTNANKYISIQAWYYALDPESKKDVERIIKEAPKKNTNKRRRKKQIIWITPI